MIVDSHQHFWQLSRGDYGWLQPHHGVLYRDFGPQDLALLLQASGVDRTVLVQAAPTEAETLFLLDLAPRTAFVAGVVGWANFESENAVRRITDLLARSNSLLKGLRPMVQDMADPEWLRRPALDPVFNAMSELGLAFDALVRPQHLAALRTRLKRHPGLRAVLDHGGKPAISQREFEPWAGEVAKLAQETGAYCKLSGLVTEAAAACTAEVLDPYAAHLVACFGGERILWGSDWPVLTPRLDYGEWYRMARRLVARHAPNDAARIFGANAVRFYRLAVERDRGLEHSQGRQEQSCVQRRTPGA